MGDALNLDLRSYDNGDYDGGRVGRELFRAAPANVGRPGRRPVRRLSVFVDSHFQNDYLEEAMRASPGMEAVLAAPAMQRLELLRVSLSAEFCQTWDEYVLPASRVPCQRLRVLDLSGCRLGPPGAAADFGRLKTLKMVGCNLTPESLQAMLDAAPSLARLWLERIRLTGEGAMVNRRVLLRCPAATVAVTVVHCHWTDGIDVDAPSARSLRYTGYLEHFPFTPATPSGPPANLLEHVQLSFCSARRCGRPPSSRETPPHAMFWESMGRFSRLRDLKLMLLDINDLAVRSEEEAGTLLKVFPNLKFLELQGSHEADSHGAAAAIANLLQCCPALQEFHLNCKLHEDEDPDAFPKPRRIHLSDEKKARLALEQSMESLKRVKSETIPSPSSSCGGDDDADLAALKARSFPCLERHLRKIRLEFKLKCFDSFEVKLARFLVENALVLETMEVYDGNQRVSDHIHQKIPIWRANSSRSKIKGFLVELIAAQLHLFCAKRGTVA